MPHDNVIVGPPVRAHGALRQAGARIQRQVTGAPALLCQREPDLFFSEDPGDLRLAKELCRLCPLQAECLAGALERGEPWGVWGGELFQNGRIIPDKRPRGRPRKAVAA
jgi:WhiB family transcriptional regulator, redox-sensing transcriptional regulator